MAQDDVSGLHVVGRYQSQNIVNTLHYRHSTQTATEQETLDLLCQAWDGKFSATWVGRHIDTYQLVGVKAFVRDGAAKTPGFLDIDTAGSVVGEETPAAVCRTITLYTASTKYRRRGRVMLSGCATNMFNVDDGAVTGAEVLALGTLVDLLIDPIISDEETWTPVIPANVVDPVESIIDALARLTPSIVRSRRIRQFLIG